MRLTLINQFYTPDLSPTAHLCASLAEHRSAMGDEVTVIAGRGGYVGHPAAPARARLRVLRVWTAQLGSTSLPRRLIDWLTFFLLALLRALLLPRQDIVVCMTTPPYIVLSGILHKLLHPQTKLVLWNMDCYPEAVERTGMLPPDSLIGRVMRAMNRAIFRRLDFLICLDRAMADLLIRQYAPRDRVLPHAVIPNWEPAAFFPAEQTPPKWTSDLAGTLRDRFVVLYLGNAGYGHEFATMLDAAEQLRDEPVTFLLVGGGALRRWIDRQCQRRRLGNVLLHDYVPKEQTPAVMAAADCGLITLENAAAGVMSPSKLHANLAMGLPVIYIGPSGTNVDEAVSRFGCGISCRPGESGQVVQFIRALRQDPRRGEEFRRRARRAFDEAYCDRRTLPRFDEIFAELLRRSSGQSASEPPATMASSPRMIVPD